MERSTLSTLAPRVGSMRRANPHQFVNTPPEATVALMAGEGERLRAFGNRIWECAAGAGAIVRVLEGFGCKVVASDIRRRGVVGEGGVDFLRTRRLRAPAIVTNPPYADLAGKFIRHAVALGVRYLALLLPAGFFQGSRDNAALFSELPPSRIWPLAFRLDFTGAKKALPLFHSWFVWELPASGARRAPTLYMPPLGRPEAA